jgi:hypothetical protein
VAAARAIMRWAACAARISRTNCRIGLPAALASACSSRRRSPRNEPGDRRKFHSLQLLGGECSLLPASVLMLLLARRVWIGGAVTGVIAAGVAVRGKPDGVNSPATVAHGNSLRLIFLKIYQSRAANGSMPIGGGGATGCAWPVVSGVRAAPAHPCRAG